MNTGDYMYKLAEIILKWLKKCFINSRKHFKICG
jgi:hypothetical protein